MSYTDYCSLYIYMFASNKQQPGIWSGQQQTTINPQVMKADLLGEPRNENASRDYNEVEILGEICMSEIRDWADVITQVWRTWEQLISLLAHS